MTGVQTCALPICLLLSNLQFDQAQGLKLKQAHLRQAELDLVFNKQGGLQDQTALQASIERLVSGSGSDNNADSEQASLASGDELARKTDEQPMAIQIDQVLIENTYIDVADQRFKKRYRNHFVLDQLSLTSLNSAQAEQLSPLQVNGKIGEFGRLAFKGGVAPFAEELHLKISGGVNQMPLPEISPYSEAYLGYQLMTGQYDHHVELTIAEGELAMENNLKLRRLKLKSLDDDSAEKMAEGLSVPLPLALDMLRDRKGVIDLDVPLEGKLEDFDVGLDDIISTALVKALKHGSMSYLQYALQPYGAVVLAADIIAGQVGNISFDPVLFETGERNTKPASKEYVAKLQAMMKEREGLSLSLCGRSNEQDQQHLNQHIAKEALPSPEQNAAALKTLAADRGKLLKRQFIEAGIEGKRVYLCKPAFDATGVGGVIISM